MAGVGGAEGCIMRVDAACRLAYTRYCLFLGVCARIDTILCTPTLCFGTTPPPSSPTLLGVQG